MPSKNGLYACCCILDLGFTITIAMCRLVLCMCILAKIYIMLLSSSLLIQNGRKALFFPMLVALRLYVSFGAHSAFSIMLHLFGMIIIIVVGLLGLMSSNLV